MCGRYALYKKLEEINAFLNAVDRGDYFESDLFPNYNVAPTQTMPVARIDNGEIILEAMHWGYMGWNPKPGKRPFLPINTRDDSVVEKPMWKKAFSSSRCIVPANGFYEWSGKKGNKTPHFIYPTKDPFFGFAGVYSNLSPDDSGTERSYSIITTSPNGVMENIHDRMPVILHRTEFDDWLNPDHSTEYILDMINPYPNDAMAHYIASKEVNNAKNNHAGLIEKAGLF